MNSFLFRSVIFRIDILQSCFLPTSIVYINEAKDLLENLVEDLMRHTVESIQKTTFGEPGPKLQPGQGPQETVVISAPTPSLPGA